MKFEQVSICEQCVGSKHRLCTSITCMQCDTPQIRNRILHELTGEKLLTNGNTLNTGSSLTLKPSTNLSEEKSNLSSDSDFEDKDTMAFSSTLWDLIWVGAYDDNEDPNTDKIPSQSVMLAETLFC